MMFNIELKAEIVRSRMTNKEIGNVIGCSSNLFSQKLHNNRFTLKEAAAISDALGLSMQRRAEIFLPVTLRIRNEEESNE